MAPEVFDKEKGHGKAVDLYAIGIIMYILLCGYPPFEPENGITTLEFPSPEWDEISKEAKDLIAQLLDKDPVKRPLANLVLRHPWISGADNVRRSRSRLFGTQKTLRRLKDLNKGDLKPGMTMREFRGRKEQPTVFNLFTPLEQPAGSSTGAAAAPQPHPQAQAPPASQAQPPVAGAKPATPPSADKKGGGASVEELFLAFQRELRQQREQVEHLRKDNLTLRAKLAEEQVLREELDGRLTTLVKSLERELVETQQKLRGEAHNNSNNDQ